LRISALLMIVVAVVFGALAVFVAQSWLNSQNDARIKNMPAPQVVKTRTIVVADAPLRFGVELSRQNLREVPWPDAAIPDGAFASVEALLGQGKRTVLLAIAPNEPILATKITGAGQRDTLSAVLTPGMKAVTLRVSDIEGVAGFVLPGDRVDVMLTRIGERGGNGSSDIVLQNVKVLAIDQIADDRVDKPAVVKAVTLEVDTVDGQKLVLAGSSGTLSLALRKAGDLAVDPTRQITLDDLNKQQKKKDTKNSGFSTISVMRGNKKENYSVPAEQQPLTNSAVNQGVIQ